MILLIHPKRLLDDLKRLLRRLEADLRERASAVAELAELLQREYRTAREAGRTGESFEMWRDGTVFEMNEEAAVASSDHRMLPRDRDVVEKDAAVGRAADRRLAFWMKRLPRPAATGADDERGPGDAEVFEHLRGGVFTVVGRERLRRLRATLVLDEQGSAAGAVVRSFGILEAALLAVDVTHSWAGAA